MAGSKSTYSNRLVDINLAGWVQTSNIGVTIQRKVNHDYFKSSQAILTKFHNLLHKLNLNISCEFYDNWFILDIVAGEKTSCRKKQVKEFFFNFWTLPVYHQLPRQMANQSLNSKYQWSWLFVSYDNAS